MSKLPFTVWEDCVLVHANSDVLFVISSSPTLDYTTDINIPTLDGEMDDVLLISPQPGQSIPAGVQLNAGGQYFISVLAGQAGHVQIFTDDAVPTTVFV